MVEADLFDKLAKLASALRKNPQPFGDIQVSCCPVSEITMKSIYLHQVIVTGDFFQLPPVYKGPGQVKFAFEADHWSSTIQHTFNLKEVFRQRDTGKRNLYNAQFTFET